MTIHQTFIEEHGFHPEAIVARYEDHMGGDIDVVNAAKVSYMRRSTLDENGNLKPADVRLLNYLARGISGEAFEGLVQYIMDAEADRDDIVSVLKHWRGVPVHKSPFNHVFARFNCRAPIYTARQLVKHAFLVWNEASGRYVPFDPFFYVPDEVRTAVADKKQGSGAPLIGEAEEGALAIFKTKHANAFRGYKDLLALGVAEELARGVLPLSTMTQWVWSGSLGAWASMCKLRLGADAQYEARMIAEQVSVNLERRYPHSWRALMTYGTEGL